MPGGAVVSTTAGGIVAGSTGGVGRATCDGIAPRAARAGVAAERVAHAVAVAAAGDAVVAVVTTGGAFSSRFAASGVAAAGVVASPFEGLRVCCSGPQISHKSRDLSHLLLSPNTCLNQYKLEVYNGYRSSRY